MSFKNIINRLKKLEAILTEPGEENSIIVFGISKAAIWIPDEDRYADEKGIQFEEYIVGEECRPYVKQAKDLAHLRKIGEENNFKVYVLPTDISIKDLWSGED